MSEELQELMDNNPEWYKELLLLDVKEFIKSNIASASRSFVAIGYYLKYIRDNQLFTEDGYQNIWEFAQTEFGFSQSWASRYMSINDRFSKDGNSPILIDKYISFDKSKLSEMLTMTDQQLEQVTITTTVAEIKNIKQSEKSYATSHKKAEPEKVATSQVEPECFIRDQINDTGEDELKCSGGISEDCNSCDKSDQEELHDERWFVKWYFDKYPDDLKKLFEISKTTNVPGDISKSFQKYRSPYGALHSGCSEWNYSFHSFAGGIDIEVSKEKMHMKYGRFVKEALDIYEEPKAMNVTLNIVDNDPEIVNDVDENVEKKCAYCKYTIMTTEEYFKDHPDAKEFPCNSCDNTLNHWEQEIDKPDQGEALPCDTCGREIQGCCDYPNTEDNYCVNGDKWQPIEPEPVETIEADIIQTVPESDEEDEPEVIDPEYYSYHDVNTEIDKLTEYIEAFRKNNDTVPGRRKAKMRYDAIILLDKEMRKPQVIEEPKPVQPELPILKNNDQRKEWAENYKTWGEWYYEQHVDCYYYKYDFPNGDRLVVEEYRERELYWKAGTHDEQHYHLLQKNKEAYGSKRTYEKKYDHTTSSMSEITDYLKDLQKK